MPPSLITRTDKVIEYFCISLHAFPRMLRSRSGPCGYCVRASRFAVVSHAEPKLGRMAQLRECYVYPRIYFNCLERDDERKTGSQPRLRGAMLFFIAICQHVADPTEEGLALAVEPEFLRLL